MDATALTATRSVHEAQPHEFGPAATALARAFYEDPVTRWIVPEIADVPFSQYMDAGRRWFSLVMVTVYRGQATTFTVDPVVGAAIWVPPGDWPTPWWHQLLLLPRLALIYRRRLPRLLGFVRLVEERHPREPHWYLPVLGVQPDWQGRGLGSALLRPVLERCDRDGMPAYLEASTSRSRTCYERLGFEVVEQLALPRGGPPIWRMWRGD